MNINVLIATAVLFLPIALIANEKGKLEGEYVLGGEVASRGIPKEGNTHLHIRLTGDMAKTLYKSSKAQPKKNDCTGYKHKTSGDFDCYEMVIEQSYACLFAINLEKNTVESSSAC